MAYYCDCIGYRKPAVLLIFMLFVITALAVGSGQRPVSAARLSLSHAQQRTPLGIKLDLTRVHVPQAGNFSYAHLQRAQHRTSLRLARFQYMLQLGHGGGSAYNHLQAALDTIAPAASHAGSYRTPVSPDSSDRAEFLTTLSIGTPPVAFSAIVDTGSDLVWLQCRPCSSCYTSHGSNTIFDPSHSSTYSVLPCSNAFCSYVSNGCGTGTSPSCSYQAMYGDGSYTMGDLSLDTLTLPDPSGALQQIASFAFGCGHDNQGLFSNGTGDGIVGLGLGPLSLPSQLKSSYLAYCLQSITDPPSKTSPLYFGNAAAPVPPASGKNEPTLTTPFFTNPTEPITEVPYYYVQLNGISVGGQLVTASSNGAFDIQSDGNGGIIFDSGTTLTSLKSDVYSAVVDAFKSAIALPPASIDDASILCYELSSASNIQLPSLTFHFEGADLQLPLANYFKAVSNNLICLTLSPSKLPLSIFGNMQQENYFIAYDLQAHTISLTPTTCDSL